MAIMKKLLALLLCGCSLVYATIAEADSTAPAEDVNVAEISNQTNQETTTFDDSSSEKDVNSYAEALKAGIHSLSFRFGYGSIYGMQSVFQRGLTYRYQNDRWGVEVPYSRAGFLGCKRQAISIIPFQYNSIGFIELRYGMGLGMGEGQVYSSLFPSIWEGITRSKAMSAELANLFEMVVSISEKGVLKKLGFSLMLEQPFYVFNQRGYANLMDQFFKPSYSVAVIIGF